MLVFQLSHYNIIVLFAYPVTFLSSVTGVMFYVLLLILLTFLKSSVRLGQYCFEVHCGTVFETSVTNESVDVPEVKNRNESWAFLSLIQCSD